MKTVTTAGTFRFGKRLVYIANALTNQRIGLGRGAGAGAAVAAAAAGGEAAPGAEGATGAPAGSGGGGGRGGADPANILGRVSSAKTNLLAVWEAPSAASTWQANDAKAALPKAIAEANAVLAKGKALSAALKPFNITFTVPAVAP